MQSIASLAVGQYLTEPVSQISLSKNQVFCVRMKKSSDEKRRR